MVVKAELSAATQAEVTLSYRRLSDEEMSAAASGAGAAAAQSDAALFCYTHKLLCLLLGAGDRLVDKHGDAVGYVCFGIFVVVVAVAGGDHNSVDLATQAVIIVHNGHVILLCQLLRRFALAAVYADYLHIGIKSLGNKLEEVVGMGVFAA